MANNIRQMPERKAKRGGDWFKLLLVLVLTGVSVLGACAVFSPWSYYMGGHFHWLPIWSGLGKIPSADGDYWLYVSIKPSPSGARGILSTMVSGDAIMCTPKGVRLYMKLTGAMARHLPTDITGKSISLTVYRWSAYRHFVYVPDVPELNFKGVWGERELSTTLELLKDNPDKPVLQALVTPTPVVFQEAAGYSAPPCPSK